MTQFKWLYFGLFVILVLSVAIYLVFYFLRKPVEWTNKNSLIRVYAPEIRDDRNAETLVRAIDFSIEYMEKTATEEPVHFGSDTFSNRRMKESLRHFKAILEEYGLNETFYQHVKKDFIFYKSAAEEVLFTGYYEAQLRGSLEQSEVYRYPIYRKPDDLHLVDLSRFPVFQEHKGLPRILRGRLVEGRRILPYYSREEIDYQSTLAGKNLEIAWIDNALDVFFLHIQGSGIVEMASGGVLHVNYTESNGHPYRAIGGLLIQQGVLTYENMSMQSIRRYIRDHPDEMEEILIYNPSYVFFRVVETGPIGAIGVPVTPYRSIATDKNLFPRGALCFCQTEIPLFDENQNIVGWNNFQGFVLNQDTGGAINGPGRVDLFTGHGEESELIAGHMKQPGMFYFLIKRESPSK